MKTVQMTLDESLIAQLDKTVKKMKTTRSAFARAALRAALQRLNERERERRHREGYKRKPVRRDEFSDWENQQVWPND
jgi:metal-responsive CopG/Arc/MetJ family transcriptional regulator